MADIKKIKLTNGNIYNVVDDSAIHSTDLATSSKVGLVKIGSGISVAADGTISVNVTHPVTSVNSKTGAVVLSASDVGAVPTTRTVNGKALSSNINLSASDVNAVATTGNETVAGVKTFSSSPIVPTPTTDTQAANKSYVDGLMAEVADAMVFKGTLGTKASGATVTSLPSNHTVGWTYKVVTAGTYAGNVCEVGDMIVCINTSTTASNADWTVYQANIDGAVTGPASSTDAHVATFNGTTGKVIKDSGYTIASSVPANAKFTDTQLTESEISAMGFTKNTGTYIKPSTGIPASDLASGVIPTVNNATLTIQKNGTTVNTFTANSASNVTANITVPTTASDVGAVPTSRTVNGKALSANITLGASDVSAVPTTRTVNGKALSANVSLTASDVGALPDTTSIPDSTSDLTNDSGFITSSDIPTSLKNPNALTFTGAVTGSYDGSAAKSVEIPTVPTNIVKYTALGSVEATDVVDADTLQGNAADYFATATGLSTANSNISTLQTNVSSLQNSVSSLNTTVSTKLSKSGGTMTGALVAQNNTNYTTKQVRNVFISTSDPSGGASGDIWIKYTT